MLVPVDGTTPEYPHNAHLTPGSLTPSPAEHICTTRPLQRALTITRLISTCVTKQERNFRMAYKRPPHSPPLQTKLPTVHPPPPPPLPAPSLTGWRRELFGRPPPFTAQASRKRPRCQVIRGRQTASSGSSPPTTIFIFLSCLHSDRKSPGIYSTNPPEIRPRKICQHTYTYHR